MSEGQCGGESSRKETLPVRALFVVVGVALVEHSYVMTETVSGAETSVVSGGVGGMPLGRRVPWLILARPQTSGLHGGAVSRSNIRVAAAAATKRCGAERFGFELDHKHAD